jgi:hypothetical protein
VHRFRRTSEVDERARALVVQKRGEVIAASDSSDVLDVRLVFKSRREDRTYFAAIARYRDLD